MKGIKIKTNNCKHTRKRHENNLYREIMKREGEVDNGENITRKEIEEPTQKKMEYQQWSNG